MGLKSTSKFKNTKLSIREKKALVEADMQIAEINAGGKPKGIKIAFWKKPLTSQEIKEVRQALRVTQKGLAEYVGESLAAIKMWEVGLRNPSGAASKILRFLKENPKQAELLRKA